MTKFYSQIYSLFTYLPTKMEQTECSETSAYTIQTPRNYPEENIEHTEHGESSKSGLCPKQRTATTRFLVAGCCYILL